MTQVKMQISVQCRHCEVDEELKAHCEEKLGAIERLWDNAQSATVRLNGERGRFSAEITLVSDGLISRAEERGDNLQGAFDTAVAKLERQLSRFKKKVQSARRRHNNRDDASGTVLHPLASPGLELATATSIGANGTQGGAANGAQLNGAGALDGAGEALAEEESVVRVKKFALKPMSPEEAALQMDLVGHGFFVFRDAATHEISVVYRRHSGGYGLIEPVAD